MCLDLMDDVKANSEMMSQSQTLSLQSPARLENKIQSIFERVCKSRVGTVADSTQGIRWGIVE